jgi:hypothetical protein
MGNASPERRIIMMRPSLSPGPWWTAHLQLPGYDPIATAGACHFDIRAAEQALVVWTQWLSTPLSPWEEALLLNLWGWRQADGRRRYATVYAEPYRQDALAIWCATLGLMLLGTAPPRRAPQVAVSYAQTSLAAEAYTHVVAAIARTPAWTGAFRLDPERQVVATPRGGTLTIGCTPALVPGEVLLRREGSPPFTLAVATRDADPSPAVAPIAAAARQVLAGESVPVLPAFV